MPVKGASTKKKRNSLTPEQRNRRMQQIMFGVLALILISSMIISLAVIR